MQVNTLSWRSSLAVLLLGLTFPAISSATPTIELGNFNLQPNKAGQTISLYVHGPASDGAITAVTLNIQVTDDPLHSGGSTAGPLISAKPLNTTFNSAINLQAPGSLFVNAGVNQQNMSNPLGPPKYGGALTDGTAPDPSVSQLWSVSLSQSTGVALQGDSVANHVLLATVTIDTTGFGFGTGPFNLDVVGTVNGDTVFTTSAGSLATANTGLAPGSLVIVPEPSTLALLCVGVPVLLLRKREFPCHQSGK